MAFQRNLKHRRNPHNTDWLLYYLGQTTDWLSEEYGLLSEGNEVV